MSKSSSNSSKKKKLATAAAAVVLAVTLVGGGTLSYLQGASDDVINAFQANEVTVDLVETGAAMNSDGEMVNDSFKIIPGTSERKDPTVVVTATVDSYIFLTVTDTTNSLVTYQINTAPWTLYSTDTNADGATIYTYYHQLIVSGDNAEKPGEDGAYSYNVLINDVVTYPTSITNSDLENYEDGDISLVFKAYAIQAEPFSDVDTAYAQVMQIRQTAFNVGSEKALSNAVAALTGYTDGTITLTGDVALAETLSITGTDTAITINLGEYSLTNTSGTALSVQDAAVKIEGSGTISGNIESSNTASQAGAIYINGGSVDVGGATITGTAGSGDNCGGAVYVNNGSFTLTGGTIIDSAASGYQSAGAVYLTNDSSFTLSDGAVITSCKNGNTQSGGSKQITSGAVTVAYGSTFTMAGGSIMNCALTAENQYGAGAVLICGVGSTFNLSAGTISGCTGSRGGAILVKQGTMYMTGGSVTENTATYSGGAMYIYDAGTVLISGGSITSNTCTYTSGKGGGIRACNGTAVTITGGTISGNTADSGNNAYIDNGCTLTDNSSVLTDYYNANS